MQYDLSLICVATETFPTLMHFKHAQMLKF